MIQNLVNRFMEKQQDLEAILKSGHPSDYEDLGKTVVSVITNEEDNLDSGRIHKIDDGDYQGTLVFIIGAKGYQPNDYWYVQVFYGSCSGCDTLQSIRDWEDISPTDTQVMDYMSLALNIVQEIRKME